MSATFIESTHGKIHLCYLGYRYYGKRKNQNGSEYWICVKCSATATRFADLSVVVRDEHTHLPDGTDKEVLEMRKNLKRKVIEESGSIGRIVEEAYHAIHAQPQSIDLIINLPAIHTILIAHFFSSKQSTESKSSAVKIKLFRKKKQLKLKNNQWQVSSCQVNRVYDSNITSFSSYDQS